MSCVRLSVISCLAFGMFLAGCGEKKDEDTSTKKQSNVMKPSDDHHGHDHGPHGGEWFEIKGLDAWGEAKIRAGDNLVKIYIYDQDKKTLKKIVAAKFIATVAGKEPKTVEIPPLQPDDNGATSAFEIVDEQLTMAFKTAGFKVNLDVDGKTYEGIVPKDPH